MEFCLHNLYEVLKVSVFLLCYKGYTAAEQCLNASEAHNKLSCTFHKSFCGWGNTTDDDFDWKLDKSLFSGHYIAAEGGSAGSRAVLESPSVCSTGDNMLQLEFGYYMGRDDSLCQLNAYVQTEFGIENIVALGNHHGSGFNGVGPFHILCQNVSFKIIFEARKMVSGGCGAYQGVYIDDIRVDLVDQTSASLTTCLPNTTNQPSVPTISTPFTTSRVGSAAASTGTMSDVTSTTPLTISRVGSTSTSTGTAIEVTLRLSNVTAPIAGALKPPTSDDGGLSSSAVTSIVVAVLVIVAAVVVIMVVLIWRRKRHSDKSTTTEYVNCRRRGRDVSLAVANSAYDPDLPFSTAPTSANSVDQPRASAYYSSATPTDDAPAKPRRDEDGYRVVTAPNPDTTGNTHQEQMIGSPTTSNGDKAHGLKDGKGKGANPNPDEYNALSFEPAEKTAPSSGTVHYDHLHHGTEEGPDSYNKLSLGAKASVDSFVGGTEYDHLQD